MKLLMLLMVFTVSTNVFANTFKVGSECLAKVIKVNQAIGASYVSKDFPGKVSVLIERLATVKTDDGEAVVNGKITVKYDSDVLVIKSVNTIFPVGRGCYITNVLLGSKN
jgi:hypothetical protein